VQELESRAHSTCICMVLRVCRRCTVGMEGPGDGCAESQRARALFVALGWVGLECTGAKQKGTRRRPEWGKYAAGKEMRWT
jgi:hypothetical protein